MHTKRGLQQNHRMLSVEQIVNQQLTLTERVTESHFQVHFPTVCPIYFISAAGLVFSPCCVKFSHLFPTDSTL